MEAFAKSKCFRHGHDFTGDWGRIIGLLILITAISFPHRQAQTAALSAGSEQNLKFDCEDSRHSEMPRLNPLQMESFVCSPVWALTHEE